jgi:hypothetical protein
MLAAATEDEPHRRADPAGDHEAGHERTRGGQRKPCAQLRGDVHLLAERIDRRRQLLALQVDLPANRFLVNRRRSSAPPS